MRPSGLRECLDPTLWKGGRVHVYTDLVCKYEAVFCKPLTDIMHMFSSAKGEAWRATGGEEQMFKCVE